MVEQKTELSAKEIEEVNTLIRDKGKPKIMARIPKPGYVWNPTLNYPRNSPCFCKSGKKFKKCCLSLIPPTCTKEKALEFKQAIPAALAELEKK